MFVDSFLALMAPFLVASKVTNEKILDKGNRVTINNGRHGCKSVYHLHIPLSVESN